MGGETHPNDPIWKCKIMKSGTSRPGARVAILPPMRLVCAFVAAALAACTGEINNGPANGQPDAGPPPPDAFIPLSAKELLAKWSGCMTLDNFQTAKMALQWGTLTTDTQKECQFCHQDGAYGFLATTNETTFFDGITKHSSFMSMYFTTDVPNQKVIINTSAFQGANSAVGHPTFNYLTNQGMTALNEFYMATAAVTPCDPPKMID